MPLVPSAGHARVAAGSDRATLGGGLKSGAPYLGRGSSQVRSASARRGRPAADAQAKCAQRVSGVRVGAEQEPREEQALSRLLRKVHDERGLVTARSCCRSSFYYTDQAKQFWLPPDYRLEPVLADPLIEDPGQIAFDGERANVPRGAPRLPLREVAADPRHLGAEIGVLSILHTWGQTFVRHPHVHCAVPSRRPLA